MRKLFPLHPPGKIKEGARRPRLWRFKEMRFLREGGNRNPPSLKCVFGYFLHKQKVTEVPGRVALGDEATTHAAIKTKTQPQPPTKNQKGVSGACAPHKKKGTPPINPPAAPKSCTPPCNPKAKKAARRKTGLLSCIRYSAYCI